MLEGNWRLPRLHTGQNGAPEHAGELVLLPLFLSLEDFLPEVPESAHGFLSASHFVPCTATAGIDGLSSPLGVLGC